MKAPEEVKQPETPQVAVPPPGTIQAHAIKEGGLPHAQAQAHAIKEGGLPK